MPSEFQSDQITDARDAKNTLIVVIDVKNRREIVLANPSERKITAVYVDERMLMLGSFSSIFQLTPQSLFLS